MHGLAWWPSQPNQGWVVAGESIHASRPWSQFGTVVAVISGSCVSGSSEFLYTSCGYFIFSIAKSDLWCSCETELGKCGAWHQRSQRGSGATGQRLSKTGCQNLWQERPKTMILWKMSSLSCQGQNACLDNVSLPNILHSCPKLVSFLYWLLLIVAMLLFHKFYQWPKHNLSPDHLISSKWQGKIDFAKIHEVKLCICQQRIYANPKRTSDTYQKAKENKHKDKCKWFEKGQHWNLSLKITLKNQLPQFFVLPKRCIYRRTTYFHQGKNRVTYFAPNRLNWPLGKGTGSCFDHVGLGPAEEPPPQASFCQLEGFSSWRDFHTTACINKKTLWRSG